jgi:hypothetical protein
LLWAALQASVARAVGTSQICRHTQLSCAQTPRSDQRFGESFMRVVFANLEHGTSSLVSSQPITVLKREREPRRHTRASHRAPREWRESLERSLVSATQSTSKLDASGPSHRSFNVTKHRSRHTALRLYSSAQQYGLLHNVSPHGTPRGTSHTRTYIHTSARQC